MEFFRFSMCLPWLFELVPQAIISCLSLSLFYIFHGCLFFTLSCFLFLFFWCFFALFYCFLANYFTLLLLESLTTIIWVVDPSVFSFLELGSYLRHKPTLIRGIFSLQSSHPRPCISPQASYTCTSLYFAFLGPLSKQLLHLLVSHSKLLFNLADWF